MITSSLDTPRIKNNLYNVYPTSPNGRGRRKRMKINIYIYPYRNFLSPESVCMIFRTRGTDLPPTKHILNFHCSLYSINNCYQFVLPANSLLNPYFPRLSILCTSNLSCSLNIQVVNTAEQDFLKKDGQNTVSNYISSVIWSNLPRLIWTEKWVDVFRYCSMDSSDSSVASALVDGTRGRVR